MCVGIFKSGWNYGVSLAGATTTGHRGLFDFLDSLAIFELGDLVRVLQAGTLSPPHVNPPVFRSLGAAVAWSPRNVMAVYATTDSYDIRAHDAANVSWACVT